MQKLIAKLAATPFVRDALAEKADLSAFRGRPSFKVVFGVTAILLSYVICWPLISFLGSLALYYDRSLIVLVGGPLAYGLSHLVFILGMYLAGARYSMIFLRWLTRMAMLKLLKYYPDSASPFSDRTS